MGFLTSSIVAYILAYKYIALFIVSFLGASSLPLPSSAAIVATSALAKQGEFNLYLIFIVALLGNIAGDNASYWIARRYGKPVLYFLRLGWVLDSPRFQLLEKSVTTYSAGYIIISRFEGFINISVNVISGLAKVPYRRFLLYSAIGETLQVGTYVLVGYFFGSQWEAASSVISKVFLVLLAITIIVALFLRRRIVRLFTSKEII